MYKPLIKLLHILYAKNSVLNIVQAWWKVQISTCSWFNQTTEDVIILVDYQWLARQDFLGDFNSAGVGRTGAFIVIDIELQRAHKEHIVDPYGTV